MITQAWQISTDRMDKIIPILKSYAKTLVMYDIKRIYISELCDNYLFDKTNVYDITNLIQHTIFPSYIASNIIFEIYNGNLMKTSASLYNTLLMLYPDIIPKILIQHSNPFLVWDILINKSGDIFFPKSKYLIKQYDIIYKNMNNLPETIKNYKKHYTKNSKYFIPYLVNVYMTLFFNKQKFMSSIFDTNIYHIIIRLVVKYL